MIYKHLLVAIDLTDESKIIIQKACELAALYQSKISLVSVLDPTALTFAVDIPIDFSSLQQEQLQYSRDRLNHFISNYPILPSEQCFLCYGQPRQEIHRIAQENGCDLIIVGSHGRKGLAILLGSTTKELLQGASCDVLAVTLNNTNQNPSA